MLFYNTVNFQNNEVLSEKKQFEASPLEMGINEILRKKFKFRSLNEKTGEKLYRPLFFPQEQMSRVVLRYKGKPISKGKVRVNIYLDADVVAYFRTKAGGRCYQALINKALKASIRKHNLEEVLRRVIREE